MRDDEAALVAVPRRAEREQLAVGLHGAGREPRVRAERATKGDDAGRAKRAVERSARLVAQQHEALVERVAPGKRLDLAAREDREALDERLQLASPG